MLPETATLESRRGRRSAAHRARLERRLQGSSGSSVRGGIPRRSDAAPMAPLSYSQERLWVLEQMRPGSLLYNFTYGFDLLGALDLGRFRRALCRIAQRHEVLRTSFEVVAARPRQKVATEGSIQTPLIDLRALDRRGGEREAGRLRAALAAKPFRLTRGSLLRSALLRLGPAEHRWLLQMHHVIFDAWSMDVLFRELATFYGDPDSPCRPLPIQYGDYADWQRKRLSGPTREKLLDYWRERLAGAPELLPLPVDRARPALPGERGGIAIRLVSEQLCQELEAFSRRQGVTLFITLLAVFKAMLTRLCGQSDLVVGTPISGRDRVEVEGLLGFFVNMLILRTDLQGDPSVLASVRRVREAASGAFSHQEMPFASLVEALQPRRGPDRSPIFQVAFQLHQSVPAPLTLPGLELSKPKLEEGASFVDLSWVIHRQDSGLAVSAEYDRDLFDRTTLQRFLAAYVRCLEVAVSSPTSRLSELPILTTAEEHQILREHNDCRVARAAETVTERIWRQVRTRPDSVALARGELQLTFAQLWRRARDLGSRLRIAGVRRGSRVALCVERGVEQSIAMLAIWQVGAVVLPLDPAHPAARRRLLLADGEAALLLAGPEVLAGHASEGMPSFDLSRLAGPGDDPGDLPPPEPVSALELAYVVYTSGSTGNPKAAMATHGGLANLLAWYGEHYALCSTDRGTQVAGPAFDATFLEVWTHLAHGVTVEVAPPSVIAELPSLPHWLASRRVTLAHMATPLLEGARFQSLSGGISLRALLTGGERLHQALCGGLPAPIFNHYGPSEASVICLAGQATGRGGTSTGDPSIGRPLHNMSAHVMGEGMLALPLGVVGELLISGAGLGRGYLECPRATAAAFLPNPLSGSGERLYRTGDLVRRLADGRIEFLGRVDRQLKVRGLRIEPGEVEAALLAQAAVEQAVVRIHLRGQAQGRLAAYVVLAEGTSSEGLAPRLREALKSRLPEAMVPSTITFLPRLPLTANGKVDLRALPEPEVDRGQLSSPYVAPETALQRGLVAIWREVLGVRQVGLEDSFFDLGGTSLLLIEVHRRLQSLVPGIEIEILQLFRYPNIGALAGQLSGEPTGAPIRPDRGKRRLEARTGRLGRRHARRAGQTQRA